MKFTVFSIYTYYVTYVFFGCHCVKIFLFLLWFSKSVILINLPIIVVECCFEYFYS